MPLGRGDLVFSAGSHLVTPFLDRLAPARAAGFAGVSVYPYEIEMLREGGMSDAEIRARVADHGLSVGEVDAITTWLPGRTPPPGTPEPMATMLLGNTPERLCPLAEAVGARSLTLVEFYGGPPPLDQAIESFAAACDVAARHGVLVHLEFLPWSGIADLHTALRIVEGADRPNGGLLIDSWHLFRSGGTVEELRRVPGERVLYVQIDDAPAEAEPDLAEETQHRRLLPGQGSFDLVGLLRALEDIGCAAPVGVEVFSDELNTLPIGSVAQQCGRAARAVLDAAGAA